MAKKVEKKKKIAKKKQRSSKVAKKTISPLKVKAPFPEISEILQGRLLTEAKILKSNDLVEETCCRLIVFAKSDKATLKKAIADWPDWQSAEALNSTDEWIRGTGPQGPVTIWRPSFYKSQESEHQGRLNLSSYGLFRDQVGNWFNQQSHSRVLIEFVECEIGAMQGALVGAALADYRFTKAHQQNPRKLYLQSRGRKVRDLDLQRARSVAGAVNLCRHMVNLPPNELNPKTYSDTISSLFKKERGFQVEIWDHLRLKKENSGLHLAVGQAAQVPPCLVCLKYKPAKKSSKKPLAFVGKGITFDSGGLDIKPPVGMRIMKKDMGGSAAVLGLAHWVAKTQPNQPCHFYFPLAENAVSEDAFRPGDVLTSRSGLTVEVDNTDAEGRLVLADAIDVAGSVNEKPEAIIDVATLTGAIKVGLGSEIPGLFSNNDRLAAKVEAAWQNRGEMVWRMPLYHAQNMKLKSTVADCTNSAGGPGGAIRAALFLERFVPAKVPWAHLDIYAWADVEQGAVCEPGGSGQAVQGLIGLFQKA